MNKDEMNEEELFCKLFPEYTVNGNPLSPYFDLFERGYEESENRIEELEKACEETQELLDKQIEATYRLDKENAELKEKCETLEDMIDEGISYQKAKDYDGVVTSLLEQNHLFTKAKELLEKFLNVGDLWELDGNAFLKLQSDVTQFLNEVDK